MTPVNSYRLAQDLTSAALLLALIIVAGCGFQLKGHNWRWQYAVGRSDAALD
jgi:outer membrane lipopolysaccharide assembly protein LptE/RlpB